LLPFSFSPCVQSPYSSELDASLDLWLAPLFAGELPQLASISNLSHFGNYG
jgi:hypothetical protein